MIDDPNPQDWKQLQIGVNRLFNDIGLNSEVEVVMSTPRGEIEVDVYAVDEKSVDKIKYVVECKNWSQSIPQSIVHAFTTVMHETGANIGYIVSKKGLQNGAIKYAENTNISGMTYEQLQIRYFPLWWSKYFCVVAASAAETVNQYVELFNCRRDRYLETLTECELDKFNVLKQRYAGFGTYMWLIDIGSMAPEFSVSQPNSVELYKLKLVEALGSEFQFESMFFRDLLNEICNKFSQVEKQFNDIFGENIFID